MREPNAEELKQAAGRARTALAFLQLGGMAFLAVIALGFVPAVVAARWPSLEGVARLGAFGAAVLVAIGSVAAGIARLRRIWAAEERRARGDDARR